MIHASRIIERSTATASIKLALLSILTSVALQTTALPVDPLTDDFTSVQLDFYLPYLTTSSFSPHQSQAKETNAGTSTSVSFTAPAPATAFHDGIPGEGQISGSAYASFETLRAKFSLSGAAQRADIFATANDVFTVAAPLGSGLEGTPGSMTFVYSVSGSSGFTTNPNEGLGPVFSPTSGVLFNNLRLIKNTAGGGEVLGTQVESIIDYGNVIAKYNATAAGPAVVASGGLVIFEVPFIYGDPISLNLTFRLGAVLDRNVTIDPSTGNIIVKTRLIDELFADFSNTTSLLAIVNEEQGELTISGVNNDYTGFASTVFPEPVPLPPAVVLFASALIAIYSRRRLIKSS